MIKAPLPIDFALRVRNRAVAKVALTELPERLQVRLGGYRTTFAHRHLSAMAEELGRLAARMIPAIDVYLVPSLDRAAGLAFPSDGFMAITIPFVSLNEPSNMLTFESVISTSANFFCFPC